MLKSMSYKRDSTFQPVATHIHITGSEYAAKHRPAHDKYLWTITINFSQSTGYHSLMMDPLWSETCWE